MKDSDIIMGYKCNNNCMHCARGNKDRNLELSFRDITQMLDGAKERGATRIILQGGEPTIRGDFFEIIKYAKKKKFRNIQMMSNGRMFSYREFAEKTIRRGVTEFCVSLHNCDEKKHDSFTRVKGSFKQSVKGIKNLIKLGQRVKILIIITKKNYRELPEIMNFLIDLGIRHIQIGMVGPFGNAFENFEEVVPKFSEVRPYLIKALKILEKNEIVFHTQDIPKCFLGDYREKVMEDYLPLAEKVYPELVVLNYEKDRREKKEKPKRCKKCKYFESCEGIYKEYLKRVGKKELKPIN